MKKQGEMYIVVRLMWLVKKIIENSNQTKIGHQKWIWKNKCSKKYFKRLKVQKSLKM